MTKQFLLRNATWLLSRREPGRSAWMIGRRPKRPPIDPLAIDPRDPVQSLDEVAELQVEPLEVDAQSLFDADAAQDLAELESEIDEGDDVEPDPMSLEAYERTVEQDTGGLYRVHTPVALEREPRDDDRALAEGQNWFEALEASATEYGPSVEAKREAIVVDDERYPAQKTPARRDTPVADHGSAGPRGL